MSTHKQGNGHMNAAVLYGAENLKIETVDIPKIGDDEVLVRVDVALTCGTDLKVWKRGYHARMIQPPSLFGHELAGVIEETRQECQRQRAARYARGAGEFGAVQYVSSSAARASRIFARICSSIMARMPNTSAFRGRIVRQNMMEIPDGISFKDAAMAEPLACVLRGIHETGVHPGDTVVVIGCGPIGLKFIRILSQRKVRVIAIGKRKKPDEGGRALRRDRHI